MRLRPGLLIAAVIPTLALAACSSSASRTATPPTTISVPPSASSTPASTAPANLTGTHSVDISWNINNPQLGVACPTGLKGYCSHLIAVGSDSTLGALGLDEYVATPSSNSCSSGAVQGTFALSDATSSAMTYTGVGTFCWSNDTGTFDLVLHKGTGQLAAARGTLTAKITDVSGAVHDEWTGPITFAK